MKTKKGFTLIELMIVVAIIGILAAIAIPKFAQLITKGNEASIKGNLGAIRSALSIYYGDTEGFYPTDLMASLTSSAKYLTALPAANVPNVGGTGSPGHQGGTVVVTALSDVGGWSYTNLTSDANWGQVLVNCSHNDTKGSRWTGY